MQNILRFIGKYHFFLLFLFFEVIAFYLIVNYNNKHKEIFLNSSNSFSSFFLEISGGIKGYFLLKQANEELSRQNTYLRMLLSDNEVIRTEKFIFLNELPDSCRFIYQSARVINNSVNKGSNYITINLGSSSNIKPGTGLISARGLVGIVTNVSKNYSVAISLLNTKFRVSAKLRNSEYFGSLTWDGKSYQHAILREIPAHASVQVGEAIVTSGYSAIFPEGILIGIVESYAIDKGEGFYTIKVKLSVDFKNLSYIETVENVTASEQFELEKEASDD